VVDVGMLSCGDGGSIEGDGTFPGGGGGSGTPFVVRGSGSVGSPGGTEPAVADGGRSSRSSTVNGLSGAGAEGVTEYEGRPGIDGANGDERWPIPEGLTRMHPM